MSKSITLSRDYAAPPERLFKAWTDLATLTRWFGCGNDMLWTVHAWDVRPGGAIHVSLQFPNGPFVVHGEFLEVEAPRKLTYRWSDDERVEVEIAPNGSGSRMTLTHSGIPDDRDPAIQTGGWTAGMDMLSKLSL